MENRYNIPTHNLNPRGYRKRRARSHGSSTPGSTKGTQCQASALDRFFATRNSSWKHPGYVVWCKSHPGK